MEVKTENAGIVKDDDEQHYVRHVYRTKFDLNSQWSRRTTDFYGPMRKEPAEVLLAALGQAESEHTPNSPLPTIGE